MSFDIDDEDREYFYKQHGRKPSTSRWHGPRRSRSTTVIAILTVAVLYLYLFPRARNNKVDWSRYAYSQYATDPQSMCNAFMVFEALHRLGSKAERVLLYPEEWDTTISDTLDRNSQLLVRAEKQYKVILNPVKLIGAGGNEQPGTIQQPSDWDASITKLRAFELTEYERVLHLDSDITLLQHLDELFLLPKAQVAMPRAYWANPPRATQDEARAWPLTSLLLLLEPNRAELQHMLETIRHWQQQPNYTSRKYDMDILNHRFGSSAMVLPHRPYALLTAEFRQHDHSPYLGKPPGMASWDADAVLKEAKLVHFSDWPLPKPWIMWPLEGLKEMQPDCGGSHVGTCRERVIWKELYDDFRKRRKDLCRILSVPAPAWEKAKNSTTP